MSHRPPIPLFSKSNAGGGLQNFSHAAGQPKNRNIRESTRDADARVLGARSPESRRISKADYRGSPRPIHMKGIRKQHTTKHDAKKRGRPENSIEDILSRHATTLKSTVQRRLDESEQHHISHLNELTGEFDAKLKLETALMQKVTRPIGNDVIVITSDAPTHGRDSVIGKSRDTTLQATETMRLEEVLDSFRDLTTKTERELDELWLLWTEVQSEICAMMIEAEEIEDEDEEENDETHEYSSLYERDTIMNDNVDEAIQLRQERKQTEQGINKQVVDIERKLSSHAEAVRKDNRELQRRYMIDTQGFVQQLTAAVAGFS